MFVVPASAISRNSVGYDGISPLQSRWEMLWLVAALTTEIPYFAIQINEPSIECSEYRIGYATNLLQLPLSCKNYIGCQFSTEYYSNTISSHINLFILVNQHICPLSDWPIHHRRLLLGTKTRIDPCIIGHSFLTSQAHQRMFHQFGSYFLSSDITPYTVHHALNHKQGHYSPSI